MKRNKYLELLNEAYLVTDKLGVYTEIMSIP